MQVTLFSALYICKHAGTGRRRAGRLMMRGGGSRPGRLMRSGGGPGSPGAPTVQQRFICKVCLLFSTLYAKCAYYVVLHSRRFRLA